jgi:hypothetical protein
LLDKYLTILPDMPDSSISEVPCANNELVTDAFDEFDVLKIDTFDKLDELLRTTEKQDLAAVRQESGGGKSSLPRTIGGSSIQWPEGLAHPKVNKKR